MSIDIYELGLAVAGLAALLAAWIPAYTERRPLSLPIILVVVGAVIFLLPIGLDAPDPRLHLPVVERVTEIGVIVALMGAGLKIDRPFAWRTWTTTWRLLAIAMPITIALTALFGALIGGLGAATAFLLGAVLAPTDPVLASDVQVGEPTLDKPVAADAEDEVRFALTSEGGLNDALAFPFVYAATAVTTNGWDPSTWALEWIGWDLIGRIAVGITVGIIVGRTLGIISFRPPGRLSALADTPQGFVAIAATLLAYGATELLQGYGFLAVFVAAVALRSTERNHDFHDDLHTFTDQTENLLVVALLLMLGGVLMGGILAGLTWTGAVVALLVVFIIRPLSGHLALARSQLSTEERWTIAFFGIRGFGSVYYLAYALNHATFTDTDQLWAIVALTLVLSIAAHGIAATPAMAIIDRARRHDRSGYPPASRNVEAPE